MGLSTTNRFNPFRKFAAENVGSQTRNKSRIIIYRAIFNLVSKVICIHFDWLRYCAFWLVRKTRAIFSASEKQNQKQLRLTRSRFLALCAGCMYLLGLGQCAVDICCDNSAKLLWQFGFGFTTLNRELLSNNQINEQVRLTSVNLTFSGMVWRNGDRLSQATTIDDGPLCYGLLQSSWLSESS